MKLNRTIDSVIIETVCLLYALLFVYASVSKLLDFENFQVQLGQSPLLSAFAFPVSYLVPVIELVIAIVLFIPKWRYMGLLASLCLMTMFTAYIFIILHYSSFVPCSCGGILEKMSWNVHLVFNILFVGLATLAILLSYRSKIEKNIIKSRLSPIRTIPIIISLSTILIIVLFLSSEEIMHHKNPFVRRYIKSSVELIHTQDLKFNSYYFSGHDANKIYLGNYTTPLYILSIDTSFRFQKTEKINFKDSTVAFSSIKILVRGKYFYLMDGSIPCMYIGNIKNWKILTGFKNVPSFTVAEPIDSSSFVFRNNKGVGSANLLGIYSADKNPKIHYTPKLLQKQIDGIFDTDGMLLFSTEMGRLVYVYFYRNEIIIADKYGQLTNLERTIDTISHAKIKVVNLKNETERKMSAPPLIVNAHSTIRNNLLFIESKVPGLYENDAMWKHAAIIDVYNIKKHSYILSFPVFGIKDNKLQSLFLSDTYLYVLMGNQLVAYKLKDILKKEMQKG